jgi:hypothetical protein
LKKYPELVKHRKRIAKKIQKNLEKPGIGNKSLFVKKKVMLIKNEIEQLMSFR